MLFFGRILALPVARNSFKVYSRNYPRWTSRKPLNLIAPEEYDETTDTVKQPKLDDLPLKEALKVKWRYKLDALQEDQEVLNIERESKLKKKVSVKTAQKATHETTDMFETVFDQNGDFVYTKMKNNDSRVGQILTTVKSKKELAKKSFILLEGKRLIKDALLSGCTLKYLLFSKKSDIEFLKENLPKIGTKIYKMPYREMQLWSDLSTCPGIMGIFATPNTENFIPQNSIPLIIYCDNIREPGNLGAVLRVAASVGCRQIILSSGCTNLWDTKVTRTSAGSHFRVQIVAKKNIADLREKLCDPNCNRKLLIADNNLVSDSGTNVEVEDMSRLISAVPLIPYYSLDIREINKNSTELILVIGGETHGLSMDVYKLAKEFNGVRLNIPMSNGVDSLNTGTALGVIAFELYRQLMTSPNPNK